MAANEKILLNQRNHTDAENARVLIAMLSANLFKNGAGLNDVEGVIGNGNSGLKRDVRRVEFITYLHVDDDLGRRRIRNGESSYDVSQLGVFISEHGLILAPHIDAPGKGRQFLWDSDFESTLPTEVKDENVLYIKRRVFN